MSQMEEKFVIKELIWNVDGKIVLVISNGVNPVNNQVIANHFSVTPEKCNMVPHADIQKLIGNTEFSTNFSRIFIIFLLIEKFLINFLTI